MGGRGASSGAIDYTQAMNQIIDWRAEVFGYSKEVAKQSYSEQLNYHSRGAATGETTREYAVKLTTVDETSSIIEGIEDMPRKSKALKRILAKAKALNERAWRDAYGR